MDAPSPGVGYFWNQKSEYECTDDKHVFSFLGFDRYRNLLLEFPEIDGTPLCILIQQEQPTVTHGVTSSLVVASLRTYLSSLQESGLDGIPSSLAGEVADMPAPTKPDPSTATEQQPAAFQHPDSLQKIRKDLGECQRCKLGKTRKNLVFGVGNPHARLVFVGEGPGGDEDLQGEPFVGEAGRILNRVITAMGLKREEVYICNVVKCRPPGNRDPEAEEIATCAPFLLRQIQTIKPEVIVALGKFATHTLLGTRDPISKLRGKFRDFHGIPLMPTFHPSYLLHRQGEGNMESFWNVWDDMTQVLRLLKLPVPDKSRKR
ncbi:MAG: uracil-DNA glycosylase [Desulfuromonadales bacterium]|nr:uracil-DNA glycosylase [Desulfuromonadales bacterium]